MQETLEQVSTQLTAKWNDLPKNKKIQLGIAVIATIVVIGFIVAIWSKPKMTFLYHENLDTKQIAEVVQVLESKKIPYQITENGMNIQVSEKNKNIAKLALATENVPQGRYTFADAINNTMSTTETEKNAKLHHLAENQLAEMLMAISSIRHADVSLVVPKEKNAFIQSKTKSSASIVLRLVHDMSTKQIEGIARLVSSSVENLDVKDITILDTEGNTLYTGQDDGVMVANKQQELKYLAEQDIIKKVQSLLEPIYDEIRVSPNLILDFNQHEELRESYLPQEDGKGLPSRETTQNSSATNMQGGLEAGFANNGGDVPTYPIGGEASGESKFSSKDVTYVNDKIISNTIKNIGDIDYNQSSVAVHVFKEKIYRETALKQTLENGQTWEMFKEENKHNVPMEVDAELVASIKSGTGLDQVVVYGYEKPRFIDEEVYIMDWKAYIPFVLMILLVLIGILAIFKFRKHEEVIETEPELEVEEMLNSARQEVQQIEDIELKEVLETKKRIEKFVDEKPEAVANLLRNWLTEDDWE